MSRWPDWLADLFALVALGLAVVVFGVFVLALGGVLL